MSPILLNEMTFKLCSFRMELIGYKQNIYLSLENETKEASQKLRNILQAIKLAVLHFYIQIINV